MKKFCRIFWSVDKQQAWLDKMSASGFELIAKKGVLFHFESCEKNEFIYKVELLPRFLSAGKREELETGGIKVVFSNMRRVCLKKTAKDGAFDSEVSLNGGAVGCAPGADGRSLITTVKYADLAAGNNTFTISGVKYPRLFPSYSFTFTAKVTAN